MPVRAVFSDLDGTLVHFKKWFDEHGTRVVSEQTDGTAVLESPDGEQRVCRVLPSSTMGGGFVSERTVELVDELRADGVIFVVVTAARKSTLMERLPLLPHCDAAVCETGSRILVTSTQAEPDPTPIALQSNGRTQNLHLVPEHEWPSRFEHVSGPLERELAVELRPEPLWALFRRFQQIKGLLCDSRSYYGCFRVDTCGNPEVERELLLCIRTEMPAEIAWAMNLGKYDFYPAVSGKGNVVSYLQQRYGLHPDECACLFDDDNDLPMAHHCRHKLLPGLTSDSVRRAVAQNPDWEVASRAGQGVFAIEECLERLLRYVREKKTPETLSATAWP